MKLISWPLLRQELRQQPKRWQIVLLICNLCLAFGVSGLSPLLSAPVLNFLHRVFRLDNLTEVVLLNDYLSFYMLLYWVVFFEVLAILVIPSEEGYLSLFLSKPLTRRQYLLTRLLPVLGLACLLALLQVFGSALAILLLNGTADFSWGRYLASVSISLGLGLVMVLIVQALLLWLRNTYNAIIAGFVFLILPVLPSSLLMYRPEIFVAHPALRWWIVFPANLIWLKDAVIPLALWLTPLLLLLSGALICLTAELMERQELT